MRIIICLLLSVFCSSGFAQQLFDLHPSYNIDGSLTSNICVGVVDLNGDFKDDLLFLNGGTDLYVAYQSVGTNDPIMEEIGNIGGGAQWTISAGDLDNDGLNDILVSGFYDGLKVYKKAAKNTPFERVTVTNTNFFAQGSNAVDINNDGWLDSFICDDDAESEIFINDGTGQLVYNNMIDMVTVPASDNSGNYGSTWIDIDNDRDLDLYIAKCRQFTDDPTDPRRINALFINDGTNHYTEQAADFGLKIGYQSWTADFGDVDNDGDLDCFIVNHDYKYQLLIQEDDGKFYESPDFLSKDLEGLGLQGTFTDFDNDGYLDILVSGSGCYLLLNQGDTTFTQIEKPFGLTDPNSYAVGDINDDGFSDVFVNYGVGFSGSGSKGDEVYINKTNDNNWLKFTFEGNTSNSSAVGTRLECYTQLGKQIREVKAGQSYGIMNSLNQIIGLGTTSQVDSVVVYWPSGTVDRHYNLTHNSNYHLQEGGCIGSSLDLVLEGENVLCPGETITLSYATDEQIEWSNGGTQSTIEISTPGVYYLTTTDSNGCKSISNNIQIMGAVDAPDISIAVNGSLNNCLGEGVQLSVDVSNNIEWSNGATGDNIEVFDSGVYYADVESACGLVRTDSIEVSFAMPNDGFKAYNDTVLIDEVATLTATGEKLLWYNDISATEAIAEGESFVTPILSESTSYYVENVIGTDPLSQKVGENNIQEEGQYSGNQFNGALIFDVFKDMIIDSVTIETSTPGPRIVELLDGNQEIVSQVTVDAIEGRQTVYLGMNVPAGTDYSLTTNEAFNNENLGYNSPLLVRNSENVNFPFTVEGLMSIKTSNYGEGYFYYFYDWTVHEDVKICVSDRLEVIAVVKEPSNTLSLEEFGVELFPIPTKEFINVKGVNRAFQMQIFDIQGALLRSVDVNADMEINISQLSSGTYNIVLTDSESNRATASIIKI